MFRQFINDYLSFTQKERIAVITLIFLVVGLYILPYLLKPKPKPPSAKEVAEFKAMEQELVGTSKQSMDEKRNNAYPGSYTPPARNKGHPNAETLFYFDPNVITEAEWKRLGLRDKTIQTISKYRARGGQFNKADDLKKVYGLRPEEYERIAPYVRIEAVVKESFERRKTEFPVRAPATPKRSDIKIDINTSDTSAWIALSGIGSKLAGRIVHFRERLGGFHSVDQVAETYGLPDSTFQKIRPFLLQGVVGIRKININTADLETLKIHPYIRGKLAAILVKYREQHGTFTSLEDLQQIGALNPEMFSKILPYLKLQE